MRYKLLAILVVFLCFSSLSQEKYSALLLSIDGVGVVKKNNKTIPISIPQNYEDGDELSVSKGKAIILGAEGNEIEIKENETFAVSGKGSSLINQLGRYSNSGEMLSQNAQGFSLRGDGNDNETIVFPEYSYVTTRTGFVSIIIVNMKPSISIKLECIEDSEVLMDLENVTDSIIAIKTETMKKGNSYEWEAFDDSGDIIGTGLIEYGNPKSIFKPNLKEYKDYLKAFAYYVDNSLMFDAFEVIVMAELMYPEMDYTKYLKAKMVRSGGE